MEYTLLKRAAQAPGALFLHEPAEIDAFRVLLKRGLVAGEIHSPSGKTEYAVIHCLTPDGRALLALQEFVARERLKSSLKE